MDQMMVTLLAMYRSSSSEVLEGTKAHRRSPTGATEQEQQHQSAPGSSGASEQARPPTQEHGEVSFEEAYGGRTTAETESSPTPTVVVDVDEEDTNMNVPISCHLKRRKS
ncbi:hypothetical protein Dimus_028915, partial [Dionaea muscipula]